MPQGRSCRIETCPSGALSYSLKNPDREAVMVQEGGTKVEVLAKGPLIVHGNLEVTLANGSRQLRKKSTAFCRCGASGNKPYCDGTHNNHDFEG